MVWAHERRRPRHEEELQKQLILNIMVVTVKVFQLVPVGRQTLTPKSMVETGDT